MKRHRLATFTASALTLMLVCSVILTGVSAPVYPLLSKTVPEATVLPTTTTQTTATSSTLFSTTAGVQTTATQATTAVSMSQTTAPTTVQSQTTVPADEPTVDNDEDGVQETVETLFGTSEDAVDTDEDGLSDYIEIYQTATDPLSDDGNGDGVLDGEDDSDGDTLSNADEVAMATDPSKKDSDSDGIDDGEEITVVGTDPLVYDTDADGVNDGYEQQLGTDPATPQETFRVSASYEGEQMTATVSATLQGSFAESLTVNTAVKDDLFPQEMPGYLGEACDVTADGTWDEATVSFTFDNTAAVEPTVYYFSEESQTLEAVATVIEGQTVSAQACEAGTYVLLDRAVYEASFVWEDYLGANDVYAGVEIVLVTDDSGSMRRSDRENERLAVATDLIDRLPEGSRIGVVRVSTEATVLTETLTADREAAKAFFSEEYFVSDGNTAMYTGIGQALELLEDCRPLAQKVMIVLSDGFPTDYALYEETVQAALQSGVTTYCVTLGRERMNTVKSLVEYAQAVDAIQFTPETADELSVVYEDISRLVDLVTDTDGDTIPDYYEDHMVAFNGVRIPLDKTKTDTDDDGVPDNEEVSVELLFSEDGEQVLVKGYLLSDPSVEDSDGDGDPDGSDKVPYDNTFSGTMKSDYATSKVTFAMDYEWFGEDNTVYNPALSKVSSLFSAMAYAGTSLSLSDTSGTKTVSASSLAQVLTYFGMKNAKSYSLSADYSDNHLSEVIVGHRTVAVGNRLKTVVAVVVRGTNATIEEWSSNCDIGDISKDKADDDWVNTLNHKGFDIAANRIMSYVKQYVADCGLYEDTLAYWVTGHSRGAAIANIIGASLEAQGVQAFTYTFASPATTLSTDAASYKTIFNIINADDFVPCLPIADWGYACYGVSSNDVSVRESYEKTWEKFTNITDYNSDVDMDSSVTTIGGILTRGMDPRVDCYRYTCACHGDGTNDTITIKNNGMSESSRENAIAKIPANALPNCIITRYDGGWISGWDFEVCQTPGYFMQLLAAYMGGAIDAYRFAVELNIAGRYESAKTALISVGISGVKHPHYPETYYVLAENLTAQNFG